MKILEHVRFNLRGEEVPHIIIIGETALGKLHFKIVKGKIFQNPSKGKKSSANQQATTSSPQ